MTIRLRNLATYESALRQDLEQLQRRIDGIEYTLAQLNSDEVMGKPGKLVEHTSTHEVNNLNASTTRSGATQSAAGAAAGEIWVDTSASNVLKLGT